MAPEKEEREDAQRASGSSSSSSSGSGSDPCGALRTSKPYWHAFETRAKKRWQGRSLVDIFVTEFRDRTLEYYVWAIRSGYVTINGQVVDPTYVLKDGDTMLNKVHRHEPSVSAEPIKILYHSQQQGRLVVVKPGSIPVHPAGRYARHTLLSMLEHHLGLDLIYTSNRLDRLTSGVMILSLDRPTAQKMSMDMTQGLVRKAYVARAKGKFPERDAEVVTCREPILGVDRQTGLNVVHPLGKQCETIFQRLSYDQVSDTSVVLCRPITGRTHQIRVHLQWLGHAIPNDPIYAHPIWASNRDLHPAKVAGVKIGRDRNNLEPGQDGYNAETAGCPEIASIVQALKTDKDDKEDWARWRDEVKFGKICQAQGWALPRVDGPNAQSAADPRKEGTVNPTDSSDSSEDGLFCDVCKPEPPLSSLYIYLHAIKYETDEWAFEDELPWWARHDWRSRAASDAHPVVVAHDNEKLWPTVTRAQGVKVDRRSDGKLHVYMHDSALPTLEQTRQASTPEVEAPGSVNTASRARTTGADPDEAARACLAGPRKSLIDFELRGRLVPEVDLPDVMPAVMFEVWGGLEDYAQREVEATLRRHRPDLSCTLVTTALHSGHLVVQPGDASQLALRLYISGNLNAVKAASILLHQQHLPTDLLRNLQDDRQAIGERKRNARKAAEAQKKQRREETELRDAKQAAQRRKEKGIVAPAPTVPDERDMGKHASEAADVVVERLATKLRLKPNTKQKVQSGKAEQVDSPARSMELNDQGQTPSEVQLLTFLEQGWRAAARKAGDVGSIDTWTQVMLAFGVDVNKTTLRTFRATVERSSYIFPTLTQMYLEGQLGEEVGLWLHELEDARGTDSNAWHVSLRDPPPSLNLTLKFVRGLGTGQTAAESAKELTVSTPAGSAVWCLALPSAKSTRPPMNETPDELERLRDDAKVLPKFPSHRPPIPTDLLEGGTALARYRAYLMSLALPLPHGQEQNDRLRILEPCVGSGAIAVELYAALEARSVEGVKAEILACDADQAEVGKAEQMFRLCGLPLPDADQAGSKNEATISLACLDSGDPVALSSFVGGSSSVDAIISDLPWGHRVSSHQQLSKLYPRLVESFCCVLKPAGVALLMTAEHLLLRRACKALEAKVRKAGGGFVLDYVPLALDVPGGQAAGYAEARDGQGEDAASLAQAGREAAALNEGERTVDVGYRVYLCLLKKVWL